MKLDKQILTEMIREVISEGNEGTESPQGSLATGSAVTGATFKKFARLAGEEQAQLTKDKQVTSNENKVVKKYLEILQLAAQIGDIESGDFFLLLNNMYRRLKKLIEAQLKKDRENRSPDTDTQTQLPIGTQEKQK